MPIPRRLRRGQQALIDACARTDNCDGSYESYCDPARELQNVTVRFESRLGSVSLCSYCVMLVGRHRGFRRPRALELHEHPVEEQQRERREFLGARIQQARESTGITGRVGAFDERAADIDMVCVTGQGTCLSTLEPKCFNNVSSTQVPSIQVDTSDPVSVRHPAVLISSNPNKTPSPTSARPSRRTRPSLLTPAWPARGSCPP